MSRQRSLRHSRACGPFSFFLGGTRFRVAPRIWQNLNATQIWENCSYGRLSLRDAPPAGQLVFGCLAFDPRHICHGPPHQSCVALAQSEDQESLAVHAGLGLGVLKTSSDPILAPAHAGEFCYVSGGQYQEHRGGWATGWYLSLRSCILSFKICVISMQVF